MQMMKIEHTHSTADDYRKNDTFRAYDSKGKVLGHLTLKENNIFTFRNYSDVKYVGTALIEAARKSCEVSHGGLLRVDEATGISHPFYLSQGFVLSEKFNVVTFRKNSFYGSMETIYHKLSKPIPDELTKKEKECYEIHKQIAQREKKYSAQWLTLDEICKHNIWQVVMGKVEEYLEGKADQIEIGCILHDEYVSMHQPSLEYVERCRKRRAALANRCRVKCPPKKAIIDALCKVACVAAVAFLAFW